MAWVSVEVDIGEFDDDEIIEYLEERGYFVSDENLEENLTREEYEILYSLLDDLNNFEHRRIREKLFAMEVKK